MITKLSRRNFLNMRWKQNEEKATAVSVLDKKNYLKNSTEINYKQISEAAEIKTWNAHKKNNPFPTPFFRHRYIYRRRYERGEKFNRKNGKTIYLKKKSKYNLLNKIINCSQKIITKT